MPLNLVDIAATSAPSTVPDTVMSPVNASVDPSNVKLGSASKSVVLAFTVVTLLAAELLITDDPIALAKVIVPAPSVCKN